MIFKKFLRKSQEELEAAMKDNDGIDIGIFTQELNINAMEVAS